MPELIPPERFNPSEHGFRSGLEVHQQLLTREKLFCHCPAGLYSDHYDAQALRHMRPTLSELGEYDGTALMEFKTKKTILYRLNKQTVCTYEMDDNPPFPINRQAVDIAVEIALMLNCSIVGELHVIRKQYLDGSIPAGFQRTGIVGVNGWLPYKDRKIGVIQLSIEEDSCREVSDLGHIRTYTTDRLSMPLIEVVTAADMRTPQEVSEVGAVIGSILRATGKVRRGLGSVRQDVNVSVTGGTRVEIKGVPRLPIIPALTHWEAYRQYSLLTLREILLGRGLNAADFRIGRFDMTGNFRHAAISSLPDGHRIGAALLPGMRGVMSHPIGPTRCFADNIAGRVRVIACLQQPPLLLHTESNGPNAIAGKALEALRKTTGMTADDAVVIVWGPETDVQTALNEIEIRCREALSEVPRETRQRWSNGETDFERILPGAERMYPDTDSPPFRLTRGHVAEIQSQMAEAPWDRERRYIEYGLPRFSARLLAISAYAPLFNKLCQDSATAGVIGELLIELPIHYRRLCSRVISSENLLELWVFHKSKSLPRECFRMLIETAATANNTDWNALAVKLNLTPAPVHEVEKTIAATRSSLNPRPKSDAGSRHRLLMGGAMQTLRGQAPGREVSRIAASA